MNMNSIKKLGTLVGCAIGDALGNPFEMKSSSNKELLEWDGLFKAGGTFWVGEAGQYTDDTLMSIALSKSLIQSNGFDVEDVAQEYLNWYNTGNTRGIGTTTASAIHRLKMGASYLDSGLTHNLDGTPTGGNGTAMRAAPIGLVYRNDLMKLMEVAQQDAAITHNSLEPKMGSVTVALGVALLANNTIDPCDLIKEVADVLPDSIMRDKMLLAQLMLDECVEVETALANIGSSGYVPETVGAAFYCLARTSNFSSAVKMAIRCGGDTDTTGAICGALAGTHYGLGGISEEYKSVEGFHLLNELVEELINIDI